MSWIFICAELSLAACYSVTALPFVPRDIIFLASEPCSIDLVVVDDIDLNDIGRKCSDKMNCWVDAPWVAQLRHIKTVLLNGL